MSSFLFGLRPTQLLAFQLLSEFYGSPIAGALAIESILGRGSAAKAGALTSARNPPVFAYTLPLYLKCYAFTFDNSNNLMAQQEYTKTPDSYTEFKRFTVQKLIPSQIEITNNLEFNIYFETSASSFICGNAGGNAGCSNGTPGVGYDTIAPRLIIVETQPSTIVDMNERAYRSVSIGVHLGSAMDIAYKKMNINDFIQKLYIHISVKAQLDDAMMQKYGLSFVSQSSTFAPFNQTTRTYYTYVTRPAHAAAGINSIATTTGLGTTQMTKYFAAINQEKTMADALTEVRNSL